MKWMDERYDPQLGYLIQSIHRRRCSNLSRRPRGLLSLNNRRLMVKTSSSSQCLSRLSVVFCPSVRPPACPQREHHLSSLKSVPVLHYCELSRAEIIIVVWGVVGGWWRAAVTASEELWLTWSNHFFHLLLLHHLLNNNRFELARWLLMIKSWLGDYNSIAVFFIDPREWWSFQGTIRTGRYRALRNLFTLSLWMIFGKLKMAFVKARVVVVASMDQESKSQVLLIPWSILANS